MEHYISESIQPRCATPRVTLYMHYHHVCMSFCKPSPNLQEIFGDSLLSAPLDKAETELPSPERLKRRIVLKHKKLPPEGVKDETAAANTLVDPNNTNDDVHGMDIAHSVLSGILYLQVTVASRFFMKPKNPMKPGF